MKLSKGRLISGLENAEAIIADVKASRCFGKSARQLRLFEHLLKTSLSGKAADITQYSLALDVLDRPETFDPTTDSIVRVELHRLRANLKIYNAARESKYAVTIPSASFDVIVQDKSRKWLSQFFGRRATASVFTALIAVAAIGAGGFILSNPSASSPKNMCSAVLPNISISYVGDPSETQNYVESVLRAAMSQQTSNHLLQANTSCTVNAAPVFDVQYTIVQHNQFFNVALEVVDVENDLTIESHHIKGKLGDTDKDSELYYELVKAANDIAMPGSILARYANTRSWNSKQNQKDFGCLIAMYDSFAGELNSEFDTVHACLEESVKDGSAALDNYGALASSYFDIARNDRPSTVSNPFAMGKRILDNNSEAWLESSELTIAKLYYESGRPDVNKEQFGLALNMAQGKFSTNPLVLMMVAVGYGYELGQWDAAKEISDYVKKIYSVSEQSIYDVDAGYLIMRAAPGDDMELCYKYYAEDSSAFINIIVNACAVLGQDSYWREKTEKNLEKFDLLNISDRIEYLEARVNDKSFMRRLEAVLRSELP